VPAGAIRVEADRHLTRRGIERPCGAGAHGGRVRRRRGVGGGPGRVDQGGGAEERL